MLKYKGAACFRQRIVCSTLTSRPVYISHIHEKYANRGIKGIIEIDKCIGCIAVWIEFRSFINISIDYEANFLRLMEKFTNGCVVEINEDGMITHLITCIQVNTHNHLTIFKSTGTAVKYTPGIIVGGTITHDCGPSRAIGYFLEPLLCMSPFAKTNSKITLNGITNDDTDVSVSI